MAILPSKVIPSLSPHPPISSSSWWNLIYLIIPHRGISSYLWLYSCWSFNFLCFLCEMGLPEYTVCSGSGYDMGLCRGAMMFSAFFFCSIALPKLWCPFFGCHCAWSWHFHRAVCHNCRILHRSNKGQSPSFCICCCVYFPWYRVLYIDLCWISCVAVMLTQPF